MSTEIEVNNCFAIWLSNYEWNFSNWSHSQPKDFATEFYCRASQEWQWRRVLFTIVKLNINFYTPLELMRIDRSRVY